MTDRESLAEAPREDPSSVHDRLMKMDLATEVLEGLDELGMDNRAEVEELLTKLEREISDST